jgi:predicted patatin/cPLA2 family phospholipase
MKTGLVLEGGALRTIYSSGVTDGFLEGGLDFDYVVGVSAGIAYGVSFLSRQFGRNLEILIRYATDKRYMGLNNMARRGNRHCYFGLDFAYGEIPDKLVPYDYDAFAAWPGLAEAVVTDVETGKAVYFPVPVREENFTLLQATCAMPLLFPIYDYKGIRCLDGGAADAIPWKRALEQGCDRVVVVLTRERSYHRGEEKLMPAIERAYHKYPNFVEVMRHRHKVYNREREELFQAEREGRVLVFAPDSTEGFSRVERDKVKIHALWQQGLDHARARLDEVRDYLGEPSTCQQGEYQV